MGKYLDPIFHCWLEVRLPGASTSPSKTRTDPEGHIPYGLGFNLGLRISGLGFKV